MPTGLPFISPVSLQVTAGSLGRRPAGFERLHLENRAVNTGLTNPKGHQESENQWPSRGSLLEAMKKVYHVPNETNKALNVSLVQ